jgi:hypothetical protein
MVSHHGGHSNLMVSAVAGLSFSASCTLGVCACGEFSTEQVGCGSYRLVDDIIMMIGEAKAMHAGDPDNHQLQVPLKGHCARLIERQAPYSAMIKHLPPPNLNMPVNGTDGPPNDQMHCVLCIRVQVTDTTINLCVVHTCAGD